MIGNNTTFYDFLTQSILDKLPGHTAGICFGRSVNVDIASSDVWDHATQNVWVPPASGCIHALVSTSDEDSGAGGANPIGTGARSVAVSGLVDWDTPEITETVIMDGTDPVNTSNQYVVINGMKVVDIGNNVATPNVGTISCVASDGGTTSSQIAVSNGQTQQAVCGIPSKKKLIVRNLFAASNTGPGAVAGIDVSLLVNEYPQNQLIAYWNRGSIRLQSNASSFINLPIQFDVATGPAIIKLQASGTADGLDVSAGFSYFLCDT